MADIRMKVILQGYDIENVNSALKAIKNYPGVKFLEGPKKKGIKITSLIEIPMHEAWRIARLVGQFVSWFPIDPNIKGKKLIQKKNAADIETDPKKLKPDLGGKLEGKFAVSVEKMIKRLNRILSAEYQAFLTYTHYSQILRVPYREAVIKIFKEHADQELNHATRIALRIAALGGITTVKVEPIPDATTIDDMISALVRQEQEALSLYRDTLRLVGHNQGLRQIIETIIEEEQEHADELWMLSTES